MIEQSLGRGHEGWQVLGNSSLHDCMGSVEVPVGEVVTHAGDVDPRDGWFSREQVGIDGFDCFADLDQPNSDGVKY